MLAPVPQYTIAFNAVVLAVGCSVFRLPGQPDTERLLWSGLCVCFCCANGSGYLGFCVYLCLLA